LHAHSLYCYTHSARTVSGQKICERGGRAQTIHGETRAASCALVAASRPAKPQSWRWRWRWKWRRAFKCDQSELAAELAGEPAGWPA